MIYPQIAPILFWNLTFLLSVPASCPIVIIFSFLSLHGDQTQYCHSASLLHSAESTHPLNVFSKAFQCYETKEVKITTRFEEVLGLHFIWKQKETTSLWYSWTVPGTTRKRGGFEGAPRDCSEIIHISWESPDSSSNIFLSDSDSTGILKTELVV